MVAVGDVFCRWTVAGESFKKMASGRWRDFVRCVCSCGNQKDVFVYYLLRGTSRSCGCLQIDLARESSRKFFTAHGQCYTRLYRVWINMRKRCVNPNDTCYHRYGGRGIGVCEEWMNSFESFYNWAMANGYRDDLEIDRINNDTGDYAPDNCRFVTPKVNMRNRRNNHVVVAFGESKVLAEWAEDSRCLVSYNTLRVRLERGWEAEKAIVTPKQKKSVVQITAPVCVANPG